MYTNLDHTFVICAYKESEFLEECIISINSQLIKTSVKMVTSTPNEYIDGLAEKYNIELIISNNSSSLANDFNFAFSVATTSLVTIAHQDDGYFKGYTTDLLKYFNIKKDPLIYFCNYVEKRNKYIETNNILKIKRALLAPLKYFSNSVFVRRRILSVSNPICCPSVCFVKAKFKSPVFDLNFKTALDYDVWERISKVKGSFAYSSQKLMFHRIHINSETTKTIANNVRTKEELIILRRFWIKPLSNIIAYFYKKAQKSNLLE